MIRLPALVLVGAMGFGAVHDGGSAVPATLPGPRVRLSLDTTGDDLARFSLPIPHGAVGERELAAPHHDYPASDLMVPRGTPVFAAHTGQVIVHAGPRCGVGVTVRSVEGYRSVSCHLSVVSVDEGSTVRAGDVLGLSGDSGNAAGVPHLHFHLRDAAGRYVCPQPLFRVWSRGRERSPLEDPRYTGCSFSRSPR